MDMLAILLGIIAALAIAAVFMLLQRLTARDRQVTDGQVEFKALRAERDEARKEAREAGKQAGVVEGDLKAVRKELKTAKAAAFKTKERLKRASGQTAAREDETAGQQFAVRAAQRRVEEAEGEAESLRRRVEALEEEQAKRRQQPRVPVEVERPAPVGEDPAVERMREEVERAKRELAETRRASRDRDRDLIGARKLAVQHERAFQVVRGQLDIARERLAALGETPERAAPLAAPPVDEPAAPPVDEPEA